MGQAQTKRFKNFYEKNCLSLNIDNFDGKQLRISLSTETLWSLEKKYKTFLSLRKMMS